MTDTVDPGGGAGFPRGGPRCPIGPAGPDGAGGTPELPLGPLGPMGPLGYPFPSGIRSVPMGGGSRLGPACGTLPLGVSPSGGVGAACIDAAAGFSVVVLDGGTPPGVGPGFTRKGVP